MDAFFVFGLLTIQEEIRDDLESGILNKTFKFDAGNAQNCESGVYKLCKEGTKCHYGRFYRKRLFGWKSVCFLPVNLFLVLYFK